MNNLIRKEWDGPGQDATSQLTGALRGILDREAKTDANWREEAFEKKTRPFSKHTHTGRVVRDNITRAEQKPKELNEIL